MAKYRVYEYLDCLTDNDRQFLSDSTVTSDGAFQMFTEIIEANCDTSVPVDMHIQRRGNGFTLTICGFVGLVHCWKFERL